MVIDERNIVPMHTAGPVSDARVRLTRRQSVENVLRAEQEFVGLVGQEHMGRAATVGDVHRAPLIVVSDYVVLLDVLVGLASDEMLEVFQTMCSPPAAGNNGTAGRFTATRSADRCRADLPVSGSGVAVVPYQPPVPSAKAPVERLRRDSDRHPLAAR
jgi:hypothetical protein